MKNIKTILLIFLILFGLIYFWFYIAFFPLPEGPLQEAVARYNTVYAEGFSREKINLIKKGMTPQEVVAIMGEPFGGMPEKPSCPSWSQGNPNPWKIIPPFAGDIWWITAKVCFDTETNTVRYPGIVENI